MEWSMYLVTPVFNAQITKENKILKVIDYDQKCRSSNRNIYIGITSSAFYKINHSYEANKNHIRNSTPIKHTR